jgi:hypothetical protein
MNIWLPPSSKIEIFRRFLEKNGLVDARIHLTGRYVIAFTPTQAFGTSYKVPNLKRVVEVALEDLEPGPSVPVREVGKEEVPNGHLLESLYTRNYRRLLIDHLAPPLLRPSEALLAVLFALEGGESIISIQKPPSSNLPVLIGGRTWWSLVMPVRPLVAEAYLLDRDL